MKTVLNPKGIISAIVLFLTFGGIGIYILLILEGIDPLLWIAFCFLFFGLVQLRQEIFGGFTKE